MSRLDDRITKLVDELKELGDQRKERNDRLAKKWKGLFVSCTIDEQFISMEITLRGNTELIKYDIKWSDEDVVDPWYHGLAYHPNNVSCLICGSTNVSNYVSLGFAPRFAACPKHEDFLYVVRHLRKNVSE